MKRFVNGEEVAFPDAEAAEVTSALDRLIVKTEDGAFSALAIVAGEEVLVSYKGRQYRIAKSSPRAATRREAHSGEIHAPMPGLIAAVSAKEGQAVAVGEKLVVLEAMKTQQAFLAPFDGTVVKVGVQAGDQVTEGTLLVLVRPAE